MSNRLAKVGALGALFLGVAAFQQTFTFPRVKASEDRAKRIQVPLVRAAIDRPAPLPPQSAPCAPQEKATDVTPCKLENLSRRGKDSPFIL